MLDTTKLTQQVHQAMTRADVPGLAVDVVQNGAIVFHEVFGSKNSPSRPQLTPTTPFQAASLSKPVFAYAVMKLWEQGKLDLLRPLAEYLPTPYNDLPQTAHITTQHVLSHTTGFPNWLEPEEPDFFALPGEQFGYSGEGFTYLQAVVEHLTGQPLHEYLSNTLFMPLDMNHSTFAWGLDDEGNFVKDNEGQIIPGTTNLFANAAFSLFTTAHDYAQFLFAMLNPGDGSDHRLSQQTTQRMFTPQSQVGGLAALTWGLGRGLQRIGQGDWFWHWGGAQNYFANYVVGSLAERRGVVILTNNMGGFTLHEEIAQIALEHDWAHPAFDWLLPWEKWHPCGRKTATS